MSSYYEQFYEQLAERNKRESRVKELEAKLNDVSLKLAEVERLGDSMAKDLKKSASQRGAGYVSLNNWQAFRAEGKV